MTAQTTRCRGGRWQGWVERTCRGRGRRLHRAVAGALGGGASTARTCVHACMHVRVGICMTAGRWVEEHRRLVPEVAGVQDGAAIGQLEEQEDRPRAVVGIDRRDEGAVDLRGYIHRKDDHLLGTHTEPTDDQGGGDRRGIDGLAPPLGDADVMIRVEVCQKVEVSGARAACEAVDDKWGALDALERLQSARAAAAPSSLATLALSSLAATTPTRTTAAASSSRASPQGCRVGCWLGGSTHERGEGVTRRWRRQRRRRSRGGTLAPHGPRGLHEYAKAIGVC